MKFKKQKHLLTQREEANAFRFLSNRRGLIDFSSNDYLGLSKGGDEFNGIQVKGSGGSRLLAGNYPEIEQFEKFLSEFHKCESALMFNSGYNANVGFFSSVPQKGDTILYDELIHASVKDGMRLSFAKSYSFKHNSIDDLNKKLKHAEGDVYVVVEGVYSMDGDSAPLLDLANFCNQEGLILVVDEAHSIGVFGKCGEGLVQSLGIEDRVPIRIVTFGKAIGAHGAAVLSDATVKSFLINFEGNNYYLKNLRKKCEEIILVGENLCVYKNEKIVANGWNHKCFAVALNLKPEVGKVDLEKYSHSGLHPSDEFSNLLMSHELSLEHELGIVEKFITYEKTSI